MGLYPNSEIYAASTREESLASNLTDKSSSLIIHCRAGRKMGGRTNALSRFLLLASLVGAGFWLRSLAPTKAAAGLAGWRAWTTPPAVTLYFADGGFLFPVSRRMSNTDDAPRAALQALLAGPAASSGLASPIPPGVEIRSFDLAGGVARIELSGALLGDLGETAIVETMTALPGVSSVELNGESVDRTPLLYYASAKGLVAVPAPVTTPRDAVTSYLHAPPAPDLTGLPPDVRLLNDEYDPARGLVSLNFTYTSSIRSLALDQPQRIRNVLLGLIASLTEFPMVRAVQIDFEGRTRLGLGQCSDLLRTPQPRPGLLNDERLLGR